MVVVEGSGCVGNNWKARKFSSKKNNQSININDKFMACGNQHQPYLLLMLNSNQALALIFSTSASQSKSQLLQKFLAVEVLVVVVRFQCPALAIAGPRREMLNQNGIVSAIICFWQLARRCVDKDEEEEEKRWDDEKRRFVHSSFFFLVRCSLLFFFLLLGTCHLSPTEPLSCLAALLAC